MRENGLVLTLNGQITISVCMHSVVVVVGVINDKI